MDSPLTHAQVYVADVNATGAADTVRQIHDVDAKGQAEWDRAHKYVVSGAVTLV